MIKCLGYAPKHNSWELKINLSVEVLKEYWDAIAKLDNMLIHHGVKLDCEALAKHKHLRQNLS